MIYFRLSIGLIVACTLLRVFLATRVPLWFDEIYGIELIRSLSSWLEVFSTNHNNNHLLNSLFIYPVRNFGVELFYRLHSLLAAIVAIYVSYLIVKEENHRDPFLMPLLMATSYLLSTYAIEARGYSLAVMFALISYLLWTKQNNQFQLRREVFLWISCSLGILSHASFLYFIASLWVVSLKEVKGILRLLPSSLFAIFFYLVFLRGTDTVGVPPIPWHHTYLNFFSYLSGGATFSYFNSPHNLIVFAYALFSFFITLLAFFGGQAKQKLFFISLFLIFPSLSFLIYEGSRLTPRYLLISVPFLYLLLSSFCGKQKKSVAILLSTLMILFNLLGHFRFQWGENKTFPSLLLSLEQQKKKLICGGDLDTRVRLMFEFYRQELDLNNIQYQSNFRSVQPAVPCLLSHHIDSYYPSPRTWRDRETTYSLKKEIPLSQISGFSWYLYQSE